MNRKILIVDDEADFLYFVKANLELARDYKIISAKSGQEGIDSAASQNPDIILLDIILPDIDGLEVLDRVKKNPKTAFIPVIMLTAIKDDASVLKAKAGGAAEYISKPFTVQELLDVIDRHI